MVDGLKRYNHETLWKTACVAFLFFMSLYIMLCFLFGSDFLGMAERSPQAMIDGTAIRPHVYRQLVPLMTRAIVALTPASVETAITNELHDALWRSHVFNQLLRARHPRDNPPELDDPHLYPFLIISVIDYLFLIGYFAILWVLAKELFPGRVAIHIAAVTIAAIALPPFCGKYGYIYDFPVLFFMTLLSLLLIRRRWLAYFAVLLLATLNKETSIFMIAVYFLYDYRTLPRQKWWFFGLLQILMFANVKIALNAYFQNAQGDMLTTNIYRHVQYSMDGYSVYNIISCCVAALFFSYRWEDKPPFLKCWLAMAPVFVIAWLCVGNRNEYRVFYELFPALCLLSAHSLVTLACWQKT